MRAALRRMTRHEDGRRTADGRGLVIFSRLPGGASAIEARPASVKFVLAGEEVYTVGGRAHRVRAGEFLLMDEGAGFTVRTSGSDHTIGLCVYLPALPCGDARVAARSELAGPPLHGSALDPLSRLLRRHALRIATERGPGAGLPEGALPEIAGGTSDFLVRFAASQRRLGAAKASTRREILQRVERARSFLHDHADRPVTLDELADAAALSRFHLVRSFRAVHGAAPLAYHRALRLEQAEAALRTGEASASELARMLGYATPGSFSRAFERRFGMPPGRVRRG